jgi:hypothetical protein
VKVIVSRELASTTFTKRTTGSRHSYRTADQRLDPAAPGGTLPVW